MPYSDELETIFLHIPKTGGTAIKRLLGINRLSDSNPARIPSPQHLTCTLLRAKLGSEKYDRYFKFAVVRNPWARLVSEYFWRQGAHRRRMGGGFPEFVAYAAAVVRQNRFYSLRFGDHFIPQVEYTRDVDKILCFENFAEDVMSVARSLGVAIQNVPAKPVRPHDEYWEYYDSASRKTVESIYSDDIEAFGHEFGN